MKCLRCGYCCLKLVVPIIIDPDKEISEENTLVLVGDGTICPHLRGNKPGEYSCSIHDHEKFKLTPCYAHTQIEHRDTPCRMGVYIMKSQKQDENE